MSTKIERRDALRRLAVISTAAFIPGWLLACSKKESCLDVTGLSPEELRVRNETAKYVEQSMDATKRCSICTQYVAKAPDKCGSCKVVKGPVNAEGNCNLFAAKPTNP